MSDPPGGSSQPQQDRLAKALHDFGDATEQAVRAWAGRLTLRQALDITYVLADILSRLETAAEKLSRYQAGSKSGRIHDAGLNAPNKEIGEAHASIRSARTALVQPFQEAYRASGGWPELGGDPARDGAAIFTAHLLYHRIDIFDEPWPEFSGTGDSRDYLAEALICATDGLAWDIQNLARDAPEPMRTGLTEVVARLDDTFEHLRRSLICSKTRNYAPGTEELARMLQRAIPLPGRAQALRIKNARSTPDPARIAAADFPCSAADATAMRSRAKPAAAGRVTPSWRQSRRSRPD